MPIPRYLPFMHGVYDVKAGISAFGKDFGNGERDSQVFQIDEQFEVYRRVKRLAKSSQHVLRDHLDLSTSMTISSWIQERFNKEHPDRAIITKPMELDPDGLSMFFQEDLAIMKLDKQGNNRLALLSVCMPSGWAPEDKVGKPFDVVHKPVPHIEPISARQDSIAQLMVNATRGEVRFAWTVMTDAGLNHHPRRDRLRPNPSPLPEHPVGEPLLRVERQVIWGFPECRAALFLIRTYLYAFESLKEAERSALAQAVAGMSEASLGYKNMDRQLILGRLA